MKMNMRFVVMVLLSAMHLQADIQEGGVFELSLEELMNTSIVTLSRREESLDLAPGSVHVITREMIQRRGYTSLRDALQVLPGFDVFMRDMGYTGNVRGLAANDNEKFTLLINGFEMNQVSEPDFLNGPINLDSVERIEVIVGPSSIFRPANTLVATVNVITRETDKLEVVVASGAERDYDLTLMNSHRFENDLKVSVAATVEKRRGFDAWDRQFSAAPMSGAEGREDAGGSVGADHFVVVQGEQGPWSGQLISYRTVFPEIRLVGGGAFGFRV
jgi:outer membrane cobalamin receptor